MKCAALLSVALIVCSCRDPMVKDVMAQMNGKNYSKEESSGSLVVRVRYLPPIIQALAHHAETQEALLSARVLDSLKSMDSYGKGLSFLLTIAPTDTDRERNLSNDVVYGTNSGFSEFRSAQTEYGVNLKEKIWMEAGGKKYPLSGFTMENSWALTPSRNFFLTFAYPDGFGPSEPLTIQIVLDDIVPGLTRRKLTWKLPLGKYDDLI